jgi:hypothetical protein
MYSSHRHCTGASAKKRLDAPGFVVANSQEGPVIELRTQILRALGQSENAALGRCREMGLRADNGDEIGGTTWPTRTILRDPTRRNRLRAK